MGIENRIVQLQESIDQLTVQIRQLTDLYIGAIEVGELSALTPIAVELRNRRKRAKDKNIEFGLSDARSAFVEFHRTFGEKKADQLLKQFEIKTINHLASEDINRFVRTVQVKLEN